MPRLLFVLVASLALTPLPGQASESALGKPYGLLIHDQGGAFFYHDGPRTNRPSCATQDRWVINVTTPAGQAMYAAVLTAVASGRKIAVHGSGACSFWGDTESVTSLQVFD
ncbi:MAG TPA: hypothetical protein DCG66_04605 [Brevundimonas sp.]|jgi:hypothetical protein|uniref:hypothetical protein n=1 Tax=Brevundimonas aurantiaca TaxID=74316 RepID=UPI000C90F0FE|nr:hypothetical protein [Brevundimonas sp.]HAF80275.1 hypothetical protein [Brevundimonas sp.]|tara:strand:+ start:72 stop:404 length:333 start_codon:yes stop_codon:yes gene_type:complete